MPSWLRIQHSCSRPRGATLPSPSPVFSPPSFTVTDKLFTLRFRPRRGLPGAVAGHPMIGEAVVSRKPCRCSSTTCASHPWLTREGTELTLPQTRNPARSAISGSATVCSHARLRSPIATAFAVPTTQGQNSPSVHLGRPRCGCCACIHSLHSGLV